MTTDDTRLVLAYQHRPLSDALFKWIVHPLRRLDGSFYFALTAISDESPGHTEELHGSIFIYKSRADWKASGRPAIRDRVKHINSLVHSFERNRDTAVVALFRDAERELLQTSDIEIKYRLFRTGEVYFQKPTFRESELGTESVEYATAQGQDFNKWVADQCYFFLRDITHTHQHHAPSSDTVLMLHYRESDPPNGDVVWRRNIVYSLNHHIIRSKRLADSVSLFQAMGILAYCKSFKGICTERFAGGIPDLPKFNDEALLASLTARVEERSAIAMEQSTNAQIRISRAANWRVFALTFTTLVIALLAIVAPPFVPSNNALTSISRAATENLLTILMTLFLFLLFVWAFTQNNWQIKYQIGRDLLELSNVRRVFFICTYIIVAVAIVASSLYISEPAIMDIARTISKLWKLLTQAS